MSETPDLDAIEKLAAAAHVDKLAGMFADLGEDGAAMLWYPDGDYLAGIEPNLATAYFDTPELAQFLAICPRVVPQMVARIRELEAERDAAYDNGYADGRAMLISSAIIQERAE